MSIERLEMDLGADTTGEVVGGVMDPTKSGDAARMTPGGQITSAMADPTNDDLPSTSSSNQTNIMFSSFSLLALCLQELHKCWP